MSRINDLVVSDQLLRAVHIDPKSVQDDMVKTPTMLAYYSEKTADALSGYKRAKIACEIKEAELHIFHKHRLRAEGEPATAPDVKAAVVNDPAWLEVSLEEIEAEAAHQAMRGRLFAVQAKKDMLQSLGAMLRAEMNQNYRGETTSE